MVLLDLEKVKLPSKELEFGEAPLNPLPSERQPSRRRCKISVHLLAFLSLFLAYHAFTHYTTPKSRQSQTHEWIFEAFGYHGPHRDPGHPSRTQLKEKLYLSVPSSESALAASRKYATHPHLAGASEDYYDAKVILELFQSEFQINVPNTLPVFPAGSPESQNATLSITSAKSPSAWIDVYYPVLNTPLDRSLDILDIEGKSIWSADLLEDGDPLDPEAAQYRDAVPTFHGLSRGGEAEGQLVYANYGTQEDYAELVASGANLTGKIVIARYGGIFRGLKIKGAEELGAVGVLIYSDPRDDGSVTVENGYTPYPAGPARNPTSVQRGSVQFISVHPGDPSTPGYPAYENATRRDGFNIPKIPSLPISWSNAERLLEEIGNEGRLLNGKSSETSVKLVNHVDNKVTPIWNTMAAIPGHIKDEVVIVGCHRDAWVMGAADPVSGTVTLHEIIRGFGTLLKHGWKPLRTIVFASWDAEEYGLVGSTEWGEDFPRWISDNVVAYLNVDIGVSGSRFDMQASPSLSHLIQRTALDIPHPTTPGKSLWDARHDNGPFNGPSDPGFTATQQAVQLGLEVFETGVYPLGSGSDFTVFLQRLGVASSDQGFGASSADAVYHYHSVYDSQRWMEVFGDPGFHRHVAVAKHLGLLALRIADSIVVPLNTSQYALELDQYLDKVEEMALNFSYSLNLAPLREAISHLQSSSAILDKERLDAEEAFKKLLSKLPDRRPHVCSHRRFGKVANWIKGVFGVKSSHRQGIAHAVIHKSGSDDHVQVQEHHHHPHHRHSFRKFIKAAKRVRKANKKLIAFERGFIHEKGIKDREWYRHLVVAPGKWLGYGATTLPALTEALAFDKNVTAAEYEACRLTELIETLAKTLKP